MSNNIFTSKNLLPVHKRFDLVFKKGKGIYLYTDKAKYLDFGAGIAVNALGHCHKKMVKAINKQAKKLWHVSNIYNTSELNNYAEKLVKASGFADYAFFLQFGSGKHRMCHQNDSSPFLCKKSKTKKSNYNLYWSFSWKNYGDNFGGRKTKISRRFRA